MTVFGLDAGQAWLLMLALTGLNVWAAWMWLRALNAQEDAAFALRTYRRLIALLTGPTGASR